MKPFYKHFTAGDIVLMGLILILSFSLHGYFLSQREGGTYAVIFRDNAEFGRYPLTRDTEITVPVKHGPFTVSINNGSVRITESHCPLHTCMRMGEISSAGDLLVCLPNRVIVQIMGGTGKIEAITR